jgi:hypothetical protein
MATDFSRREILGSLFSGVFAVLGWRPGATAGATPKVVYRYDYSSSPRMLHSPSSITTVTYDVSQPRTRRAGGYRTTSVYDVYGRCISFQHLPERPS